MKTKPELYTSAAIDELLESVDPRESKRVENRMLLATKIANGMKARGLNKKGLMEAMGQNNQSVVTKWLSGTHNFTADTLTDLGHVLGISLLDVETKKDVVSRMTVQVIQKPQTTIYSSNYMTNLIQSSVGLSMIQEPKSYYGKSSEA